MAASTNKAPEGVPHYVLEHAPLLHLFSNDPYRPSSPAATLLHTRPQIAFKDTPIPSPPLTLDNLDQLNNVGSNGGTDVYLTSYEDVTKDPEWIKGEKIGGGGGDEGNAEKTAVVVVVDKGDGVVDAFYFYFFAFNWGGVVLEKQLGDHIGDWEHNMIRFIKGEPKYVWFSQHANGQAYTFSALKKNGSGKRPIVYCANGSHALYATPGTHDHTIPNFNLPFRLFLVDETDEGPLYVPLPYYSPPVRTKTIPSTPITPPLYPTPLPTPN